MSLLSTGWFMSENRKNKSSLIVLAGGLSRRMGQPKPHLLVNNKRLIDFSVKNLSDIFDEVLIVVKKGHPPVEPYRCIEESFPEYAPIFGIYEGLKHSSTEVNMVIACDMPFINRDLVKFLLKEALEKEVDIVVPNIDGYFEPLMAVYKKSCIPAIEESIIRGIYKLTSFYESLRVLEISESKIREFDPELKSFLNINTKEDLKVLLND